MYKCVNYPYINFINNKIYERNINSKSIKLRIILLPLENCTYFICKMNYCNISNVEIYQKISIHLIGLNSIRCKQRERDEKRKDANLVDLHFSLCRMSMSTIIT